MMDTTEWQDALLYHALWGQAADVLSLVGIDDFDPGQRQDLFQIIERGYLTGELDAAWVKDEAIRIGKPSPNYVAFVMTAGFTGTVSYYSNRLREASIRRYARVALTRGLQHLEGGSDPLEVVSALKDELQALPKASNSEDDCWTIQDIMSLDIQENKFTIPGILQRNERLVLTGSEGGGKSVFIYQLLTGAAYGVDTMTLEKCEPQRVMFIDVENNEFQARANLEKIVPTLTGMAPDVTPNWRSLKRRVVNLLDTKDRADILRRVMHYSPDILYMGTAYKLTDITDETHRAVRAIQSVVDRIRQEIDCTVIVEHHAGHGHMNDRNNMRPEGSSYWLRWPDFGYGMMPLQTPTRMMRLKAWRGDRVMGRTFPVAIKQSGVLPWAPVYQDEWDAVYAHTLD
jgi:replicative DNA helicase